MSSEEIKKAEKELDLLNKEFNKKKELLAVLRDKEYESRREPLKKLVERAHGCLCPYNHTDGCSWYYENNWEGYAHNRWLRKYDAIINGEIHDNPISSLEDITTIIETIEILKPKVKN